jgi:hypothetical protein
MLNEIFGKTLKAGDFVLFSVKKGDMRVAHHGIVCSESSVFSDEKIGYSDAKRKGFYTPSSVYLLDILDDKQQAVFNRMIAEYQKRYFSK